MKKLDINDYINKKYDRLIIKSFHIENGRTFCRAICDCGVEKKYVFESIKKKLTKSCGCIRKEKPNSLKYDYNEDFFETLTPDSAYILGLIYTDGCLDKNVERFIISLQEQDKEILEKISILLRNTKEISFSKKRKVPNHDTYTQNQYYIQCTNKKIYNSLLHYGLYPNKTNTIKPSPKLTKNRDFWRGCIDGDGGIDLQSKKYLRISFGGTKDMVDEFINFCNIYCTLKINYRYISNGYHRIYLTGKNAKIIMKIMYESANLYIKRKYNYYANIKI